MPPFRTSRAVFTADHLHNILAQLEIRLKTLPLDSPCPGVPALLVNHLRRSTMPQFGTISRSGTVTEHAHTSRQLRVVETANNDAREHRRTSLARAVPVLRLRSSVCRCRRRDRQTIGRARLMTRESAPVAVSAFSIRLPPRRSAVPRRGRRTSHRSFFPLSEPARRGKMDLCFDSHRD